VRKILVVILVVALLGGLGFYFGTRLEPQINTVHVIDLPEPSEAAVELHRKLSIVDLHDDLLLWARDPVVRSTWGHTDMNRLLDGPVTLQVLAAVTKTPFGQNFDSNSASSPDMITALLVLQRWPVRTWFSLRERALFIARRATLMTPRGAGKVHPVRNGAELNNLLYSRKWGRKMVGVLIASEGMHPLEGRLDVLDELHEAGFRMMAPTHFFDNDVAGSAHGEEKGGLTDFGEQAIDRMQQLEMIVDLAHASPATVDDVLLRMNGPLVVSHTGVQATCPGPRNLSDAHIRAIADGGGVMGIGFFGGAVCDITPEGIVKAMRHVADLVGVEHVALGSDWNGGTKVVIDAPKLVYLTDALLRGGFGDDEIKGIMGENALRVMREVLPMGTVNF
jgi:membrane dipeptidase